MGNSSARPSKYLEKQWVKDSQCDACHSCQLSFSAVRRRHHCRSCGFIYCTACWGKEVDLPPEYGYHKKVPTCNTCAALVSGDLKPLRMPRHVALTRTSTSVDAAKAKRRACPPLAASLVKKRKFEVSFIKLAGWRPINENTSLIFAVTLRSVNRCKSTFFASDVTPNTQSNLFKDGRMVLNNTSLNGTENRNGTDEEIAVPDLMTSNRFDLRLSTDEEDSDGAVVSASPLPRSHVVGNGNHTSNGKKTAATQSSTPQKGEHEKRKEEPASPGPRQPQAITTHVAGDLQLDVAYSLSFESVLRVVLDAHPEGDYITIETHAEIYRIQVAKLVKGAATEEQRVRGEDGDGKFRIGRRDNAPSKPIPAPPENNRHSDDASQQQAGSFTQNNRSATRRIVRPTSMFPENNSTTTRNSDGGLVRDASGVGDFGSSLRPSASGRYSKPIEPSSSSESDDDAAVSASGEELRTSKPAKGAVFEACHDETRKLFVELERVVQLMERRREAKGNA